MKSATQCLQPSDIEALLAGTAQASQCELWEEHFSSCESCRMAMASQVGDPKWWHEAEQSLRQHVGESLRDSQIRLGEPAQRELADERESLEELLKLLGPTDDPKFMGRIGSYEVLGVLGRGGMGIVFKAFDAPLNRFVAIKTLLPHLAASGAARKRFAREAQAVAAVVDDHVMAIHCVDEWQGVPYLVMTYSRGITLQKRLSDNGPLEVREILRIGMQAAKGLAAAHAQGIVHRDIKPANIFLDQNVERVQLMDFGLARAVDDASLTRTGVLTGTPQYMSPEQARAETVDFRSDLFSLGSVMYAMSTGHAPFRAESSYSVLRLITDKEPRPIREINPDVPEWLCEIISKLMAKHAKDRFASALEVATLLEDCLAHVQQPTTTPLPAPVAKVAKSLASTNSDNPSAECRGGFRFAPIGKFITIAAFAFSLMIAGVLVVLEFNKGTLTIECDADDVPIRIMQGNNVVEQLTVSKSPQNVRIAAGNYVVEVDDDFQGVTIKEEKVSLTRRGAATVEISKNATLILVSKFEPGNLDGLRFGERHEREEGMDPRGYWNPEVAEPGETREIFTSFPQFGSGIEEVGLIVSVEPPHERSQPAHEQNYLVTASGIRRIRTYSACEASVKGKESFKPDGTPYTVGYFQLQLDGEEKESVIVNMIAGSAHVNINYVVGSPSELIRQILKLDAPSKHSQSWLGVNLQGRPYSAWASHLMKLDGWEHNRARGVPNMIQQEVTLKSGETRTVSIEPADSPRSYQLGAVLQNNARSVVDAYVAAALAGDRKTVQALTGVNPQEPEQLAKTIDSLILNLTKHDSLATKSVFVNSPDCPSKGIALSETLKWEHRTSSIADRIDVRLRFELSKSDQRWSVIEIGIETEELADELLKKFLEANPTAISVLQQDSTEKASGGNTKTLVLDCEEIDDFRNVLGLTQLEELYINQCVHPKADFKILKELPHLRKLIFSKWSGLSSDEIATITESLPGVEVVEEENQLDRKNARSVVEAYIALALAGDVAKAAALAKNSPADPKRIKELPEFLNVVQRLKIETVYINDLAKPTRALATSAAVKLDEDHKQPDGQRDGFMVFRLELTDDKWFVIDIDFETESGAEKELERFLEANPNSIGLPPLTSGSMQNLNRAADPADDHDRLQGAWQSLDSKELPVMPGGRNQFSISFLTDRMSMSGPQRAGIGTFSLSPDTVPKQIDCRVATGDKNIELKGIYEFRDSQLWLCLTEGEQRPKSFDNPPTVTGLMTFALERKQVELPDVDSSASLAMSDWSQSQVGAGVFATYTLSIPGIETISQGLAAGGPAVKEFSGVPGFPGKVFTLRYFLPNLSPRGMAFVAGTSFQSSLDLIELAKVAEHKRLVKVFSYPDSATGASDPIGAVPVNRPVETPEVEPMESSLKISILKAGANQADWLREIDATGEIIYGYEIVVR